MLVSKKATKIWGHPAQIGYFKDENCKIVNWKPQHIYILSDEEIYPDEYFLILHSNKISKNHYNHKLIKSGGNKIIASTNPELNLPTPSHSFVKKFCELGGIEEVMVEYKEFHPIGSGSTLFIKDDNTITIKKVKESWNEEEVRELMRIAWNAKDIEYQKAGMFLPECIHFAKWIEQNF